MAETVYWDSCCFIDWIENQREARIEMLRPVVEAALRRDLIIVSSALALTETVRCNGSDQPPQTMTEEEHERIRAFFRSSFIEIRPLDRRTADRAREIHRESLATSPKVPLNDCIHIATALLSGCPVIHSFDSDHMLRADKRFGVPRLRIELPSYVTQPPSPASPAETAPPSNSGQRSLFESFKENEEGAA